MAKEFQVCMLRSKAVEASFEDLSEFLFVKESAPVDMVLSHKTTDLKVARNIYKHYQRAVAYAFNDTYIKVQYVELRELQHDENEDIYGEELLERTMPTLSQKVEWEDEDDES